MMRNYKIIEGNIPGIIGRVAELHAKYYSKEWKFGHYFEAKVSTELSSFINNYDETMDCIWSLLLNNVIEGSITVDSSSEDSGTAHLRWFIISKNMKGSGAGNHLIKLALKFCEQKGIEKVYLWTFKGLKPAKHLYQKYGFKMTQELEGTQWGTSVIEQRYELKIQ